MLGMSGQFDGSVISKTVNYKELVNSISID